MPREARKNSETGFFHVTVRGNGKQLIFEEDSDYKYLLILLKKFSEETNVAVCAYCLMENHFHLLVWDRYEMLSQFMKKLNVSYARFFNWKYKRSGHLFQERFGSEPIEDDSYFLTVLRYILRNPTKAGICEPDKYPWSSFREYDSDSFVDTRFIQGLFRNRKDYEDYILDGQVEAPLKSERKKGNDDWARNTMKEILGVETGSVIQSYNRTERDKAIKALLDAGLSERQIERLTGISRYIIHNVTW